MFPLNDIQFFTVIPEMLWNWIVLLNFFFLFLSQFIIYRYKFSIEKLYIIHKIFCFQKNQNQNRNVLRLSKYYYHYIPFIFINIFYQNSTRSTRKNFSVISNVISTRKILNIHLLCDTCTQNNSIQASNNPHSHVTVHTTSQHIFEIVAKRSINIHQANGGQSVDDMRFQALR